MTHPYLAFIQGLEQLTEGAQALPLGGFPALDPTIETDAHAPVTMVFAPHPDDECIVGALPLKLHRAMGHRILAVAVTQGSQPDRQAARLDEMRGACAFLGFELVTTKENGLTGIHPLHRMQDPITWSASVEIVANLLREHHPSTLFMPHEGDQNSTHQGTHLLVMEALRSLGPTFECRVVDTEFWSPMTDPNLIVESTVEEVADLVAATSFHKGEVARNPYHLRLPSWMSDNVRRGGELVGGQGGFAPDFQFATLYRMSRWNGSSRQRYAIAATISTRAELETWFNELLPLAP